MNHDLVPRFGHKYSCCTTQNILPRSVPSMVIGREEPVTEGRMSPITDVYPTDS